MKLKESIIKDQIVYSCDLTIGSFHFCKNVIISEINEGVHFDFDLIKNHLTKVNTFFRNRPIGYISNRINDISVNALDYSRFFNEIDNLIIYSVVRYNNVNSFNSSIEERFCNIPYKCFDNVIQSYNYVNDYIINKSNKIA